jgi:DNA primase
MQIASSVTDEVKQRVDIVEVIARYTQLKRAGAVYKGLCPFHNERTPSFVVFPNTGTWRCFGACGTGGDVITFVMRRENMEFREALEVLARQAGIDLAPPQEQGQGSSRERIFEANEAAAAYYEHTLLHHPAAEAGRRYLERRGIDAATRGLFRLGFAPDNWSPLRDFLLDKGFSLDLLLEAGLVKRNEERNSTYDMFRGRLIFPIRDRQGRVIGFGGRVLDDGVPKYLNTAETQLFHKSHVVYGLDLAYRAIREQKQVVIVEGYMDVIAAHQFGFPNVVACMGTALTPEQLKQLQHFTHNFVLALDADAAGQQATIRGLNQARQSLARVRKPVAGPSGLEFEQRLNASLFITRMPEGRDPDDVIRADPAQWQAVIAAAKPLVDFYFDVVAAHADLTSATGKGQAVAELAPLIAELGDDVERQHYIQRLSRLVQIDEMTIGGRVQAAARTLRPRSTALAPTLNGPRHRRSSERAPAGETAALDAPPAAEPSPAQDRFAQEDHLLACLLTDGNLLVWLAATLERVHLPGLHADDWENPENREVFVALKRYLSSDEPWDIELFQEALHAQLHRRLARLMVHSTNLPQGNSVLLREDAAKTVVRMRLERLRHTTVSIRFVLDEMQRSGEWETVRSFDKINNQNLREILHLEQVMVRLPQELSQRSRNERGLRIY